LLQHLIDGARLDAASAADAVYWDDLTLKLVYFAVTWGVGGAFTEESRNKATAYLHEQAIAPLLTRDDGRTFVASAYDGCFKYEGSYVSWTSLMPTWSHPASAKAGSSIPFSQHVVPTSESIRL
jgi:hypothetical protein